jgi:hypothetical protein
MIIGTLAVFGGAYLLLGFILAIGAYIDTDGPWYKKLPFGMLVIPSWGISVIIGDNFLLKIQERIECKEIEKEFSMQAKQMQQKGWTKDAD